MSPETNLAAKGGGAAGGSVTETDNASLCYQCSKCSAGCPLAEEMDLLPHQVIHLLSLGQEDEVLRSNTMWMCAGCYTCATRCPNDIDITTVMDEARAKAIEKGIECPNPDVLTFHKCFIRDIGRRGRIHEMRMMAENNIRKGKPFDNAELGRKMFFKGRLKILPPKSLPGFKRWMKRLWKR
jgi:heterodisulfide reductase subunit C